MAQLVTRLQMRTEVRRQTDAENDPHVTDDEINTWLNKGLRVFFGKIIACDPDFYLVTTMVNTTGGTLEYALPADFRALRLLALTESGRSYRLRPFSFEEIYRRQSVVAGAGFRPRYRVARNGTDGSKARLIFDIDPGTHAYTLHYVPVPPDLALDADEVDAVLGFDDYAIAYAASRVRRKRDEDPSMELAEMARVEAEIRALAKQRHLDGEDVPARVRRRFRHQYLDEEIFP